MLYRYVNGHLMQDLNPVVQSNFPLVADLKKICEKADGNDCMVPYESVIWAGPCTNLCEGAYLGEGDSGGPLTWTDPADYVTKIVGVSSFYVAKTGYMTSSAFCNVALALDWINCVRNPNMCIDPQETEIGSSFNQDSGSTWGEWDVCPQEHAVGFAVRHQMEYDADGKPSGDVTGVNSICLVCKSLTLKCSQQGPWGQWYTPFKSSEVARLLEENGQGDIGAVGTHSLCQGGFNRIYMQNQKNQGRGVEDVGLYYLGMYCSSENPNQMIELPEVKSAVSFETRPISAGTVELPGVEEYEWKCDTGFVICGVRTLNWNVARRRRRKRKSESRSLQDDVGTVGAWFKCCQAPSA